ncbi:hypothetical protein ALP8811_02412 [Aliiroseovarius pelagivivens]|uniref:Uncharacterized protein n=1 Tax=Aliiroseovarius pelagivivens TaxID=1639690 RepID=A0A2R8AMV0_9RHOB|nr:hypothetical protein [Aliiroseovarius pelagivivens]SPF77385.1 hypothetical protein ALP8811_02412 [Aliiroseovarius pelagivivens]
MMDSNFHSEPVRLNELLDDLIANHGAIRVVRALAMRLVSQRVRRPQADNLSDHLRRDVGLPPGHPPPPFREPRL